MKKDELMQKKDSTMTRIKNNKGAKKVKVIKIPYDMKIECTVHQVAEPGSPRCLDEIKELIGIEWAEIVLTRLKGEDPRRDYCLIVDEVGKLKEGWTKEINPRACQFYTGALHGDPIVGNVVLCAREWTSTYGECDLAGLTDQEEEALRRYL